MADDIYVVGYDKVSTDHKAQTTQTTPNIQKTWSLTKANTIWAYISFPCGNNTGVWSAARPT